MLPIRFGRVMLPFLRYAASSTSWGFVVNISAYGFIGEGCKRSLILASLWFHFWLEVFILVPQFPKRMRSYNGRMSTTASVAAILRVRWHIHFRFRVALCCRNATFTPKSPLKRETWSSKTYLTRLGNAIFVLFRSLAAVQGLIPKMLLLEYWKIHYFARLWSQFLYRYQLQHLWRHQFEKVDFV